LQSGLRNFALGLVWYLAITEFCRLSKKIRGKS